MKNSEKQLVPSKAKLYAASGDFKSEVDLPKDFFGIEPHEIAIYLAVKAILNNRRQGSAHTKSKSEVSGGGRKPWKQKGTGQARAGQNTSPVWVRGNKAHGPKKHKYFEKVNKKVKRLAFRSALSSRAQAGCIELFENLAINASKTKEFLSIMGKAGFEQKNVLFLATPEERNLIRSLSNVPWAHWAWVKDVNTYDIMRARRVVFSQETLKFLTGGAR
ncbi:MAG: 50S ribosomal protein L4 [Fibromonadaceae bacterium]|jgi:large subunit ribosomal protein L4|nr:50S ribosomal protein L4 [Fibromonadaceae bacterium]